MPAARAERRAARRGGMRQVASRHGTVTNSIAGHSRRTTVKAREWGGEKKAVSTATALAVQRSPTRRPGHETLSAPRLRGVRGGGGRARRRRPLRDPMAASFSRTRTHSPRAAMDLGGLGPKEARLKLRLRSAASRPSAQSTLGAGDQHAADWRECAGPAQQPCKRSRAAEGDR